MGTHYPGWAMRLYVSRRRLAEAGGERLCGLQCSSPVSVPPLSSLSSLTELNIMQVGRLPC